MENKYSMSLNDTMIAAGNLERIETILGHKVPSHILSMYDLSEPMSMGDAMIIAGNIKRLETIRGLNRRGNSSSLIDKLFVLLVIIPVVFIAFDVVVVETIFHFSIVDWLLSLF